MSQVLAFGDVLDAADQLSAEDRDGVNYHAWANSGSFVLNNDCGDTLRLWANINGWKLIDSAGYSPNPPEGAILVRRGDKLEPISIASLIRGY